MSSLLIQKEWLKEDAVLTGTLMFRNAVHSQQVPVGKKLMVVAGVVLVDENLLESESIAVVQGVDDFGSVAIMLTPKHIYKLDRKYEAWNIDQLLLQPIWKV